MDARDAIDELAAMLGGLSMPIEPTEVEIQALSASVLAERFRTLIKQAMTESNIDVRELALRLGVSQHVVTRRLSSTGDMSAWTAAVFAHALGRVFTIDLVKGRVRAPRRAEPAETRASGLAGEREG